MNSSRRSTGLILAVAGVYAFFLLFAQFAFLERIKAAFGEGGSLKAVLGLMALGGVASGFAVARSARPAHYLAMALAACAVVAAVAAFPIPAWLFPVLSLATGLSMGTVTVSLAGIIGGLEDKKKGCVLLGWGTGIAYGFCNVPLVFTAAPVGQCLVSAGVAMVAWIGARMVGEPPERVGTARMPWRAMLVFAALVWMDAAAFYVIQHAPELKQGTWREGLLWRNAAIHLVAGVGAGYWLSAGGLRRLWLAAWAGLALAGWWVNFPEWRESAGWLYPAAVSLYSTALVAWPGLLAEDVEGSRRHPAMARAAWLFGISGWLASGAGIGMVESLHRVPGAFLIIAGIAVICGVLGRSCTRTLVLVGLVGLACGVASEKKPVPSDAIARGHEVYLSEGCIHCHSRYVRPDSPDEAMWGAAVGSGTISREQPVLIGNRRQGPDLLHVGGRRSATWLREHFRDPRSFSPDSTMPAYAHLVADGRAEDLISWLCQDAPAEAAVTWEMSLAWAPREVPTGDPDRGRRLFAQSCAVCHGDQGRGDGRLSGVMRTPPRNLVAGPFGLSSPKAGEPVVLPVMRVIRFGIPGTDMPGHETWAMQNLADLAAWVLELRASAR